MPKAWITPWSALLSEIQGEVRDKALKGQGGCQTSWILHYSQWIIIQNFLGIVQMDLIAIGEPPSIPEPRGFVGGKNEGHALRPSKALLGFSLRPQACSIPLLLQGQLCRWNWCVLCFPAQFLPFSSAIASCVWKLASAVASLQTRTKCWKKFLT